MLSVKLNKQFYSAQAVKQTIAAYKHLAVFSVHQIPGYYQINFSRVDNEFKGILKDEFSNYALVLSKNTHD